MQYSGGVLYLGVAVHAHSVVVVRTPNFDPWVATAMRRVGCCVRSAGAITHCSSDCRVLVAFAALRWPKLVSFLWPAADVAAEGGVDGLHLAPHETLPHLTWLPHMTCNAQREPVGGV